MLRYSVSASRVGFWYRQWKIYYDLRDTLSIYPLLILLTLSNKQHFPPNTPNTLFLHSSTMAGVVSYSSSTALFSASGISPGCFSSSRSSFLASIPGNGRKNTHSSPSSSFTITIQLRRSILFFDLIRICFFLCSSISQRCRDQHSKGRKPTSPRVQCRHWSQSLRWGNAKSHHFYLKP